MNQLNSILLEGSLTMDPQRASTGTVWFDVENRYHVKDNGTGTEKDQTAQYTVRIAVGTVADSCMEYLKKGRGVRVVGRLSRNGIGMPVFITAEYVEFKPVRS